jgi:hypothetical protein
MILFRNKSAYGLVSQQGRMKNWADGMSYNLQMTLMSSEDFELDIFLDNYVRKNYWQCLLG